VRVLRLVSVLLLVVLALVQYRLWVGDESLAEVRRIERSVAEQQAENTRLEAANHRLEAQVSDLKEGTAAIEEQARRDLGMVGDDETFYQVVER
jgi:cell division protein FtsB